MVPVQDLRMPARPAEIPGATVVQKADANRKGGPGG
jgi:hypothetical protein